MNDDLFNPIALFSWVVEFLTHSPIPIGCAIFGWAGRIDAKLLRQLYRNSAAHGPHAVGLAYVDETTLFEKVKTFKRAIHPHMFLRNCDARIRTAALSSLGFGHTRYATTGHHTDECAHPFVHNKIIFAHNGVLHNWRATDPNPSFQVDSQILGPMIERRDISQADGSTGLIWFEHSGSFSIPPQEHTQPKLFIYKHRQRLIAITFTFSPDDQLTLVATTLSIIPDVLSGVPHKVHELTEGTAYEVTEAGLTPAWSSSFMNTGSITWCSPQLDVDPDANVNAVEA